MSRALNLAHCKGALFDVDGTLIDSVLTITAGLGDAFEHLFGVRPGDETIQSLIGMPLRTQLALYAPKETSEAEYLRMADYAIGRFAVHENLERPFPSAIKALRLCQSVGIKTALVTSKSAPEVALFRQRFDFTQQVDAIICASDVPRPKPWPDSALAACEALAIQPREAVLVGDSVYDLECARAAGLRSIAVAYGSSTHETLAALNPDLILDTPEQLLSRFEDAFNLTPCHERN